MQFEDLENFYERLVQDAIHELEEQRPELSSDQLKDIACVTLNKLPSHYIRHRIDVAFYLSSEEREKMDKNIKQALKEATEFVTQHPRTDS